MTDATIEIPIKEDLARIYNEAALEDQQKIQRLLELWLRELNEPRIDSLLSLMDSISDEAMSNGLTPEILDDILADDE